MQTQFIKHVHSLLRERGLGLVFEKTYPSPLPFQCSLTNINTKYKYKSIMKRKAFHNPHTPAALAVGWGQRRYAAPATSVAESVNAGMPKTQNRRVERITV